MQLSEYLDKNHVLDDLQSSNKREVLDELLAPLVEQHPEVDHDKALRILLDREQLGTTGIGDGVAIPHGKIEGLNDILLSVGRSAKGIAFDALDGKPCHVFFLVLAPEQAAGMHLRILAQISKLLKDQDFRSEFLSSDCNGLINLLAKH